MSVQPQQRALKPRTYWQEEASCTGMDLRIFYGTEESPLLWWNASSGRSVCEYCPVRRDCLLDALATNEPFGMRGGYLGHERVATLRVVKGSIALAMDYFDRGKFLQIPHNRRYR